jgi:hypothetical protein
MNNSMTLGQRDFRSVPQAPTQHQGKAETMLPKMCVIDKIDAGMVCEEKASGFVIGENESPMAVFKASQGFCAQHGQAVADSTPASRFVSMATLGELMDIEDRALYPTTTTTEKDNPMNTVMTMITQRQQEKAAVAVEAETLYQAVTAQPRMEVLANAPMDLVALAAELNSKKVDAVVDQPVKAPKMIAVEAGARTPKASDLGRIKTAEELEEEVLAEQIRTLMAQKDALKRARIAKEKAEAEAAKQARALASDPHYQFTQAHQLRSYLVLHGGSATLNAVETLIDAGILTVKNGALAVRNGAGTIKAEGSKETEATAPRVTSATPKTSVCDPERQALKAKVRELCALGFKQADIARQTGLDSRQVWNILNPRNA